MSVNLTSVLCIAIIVLSIIAIAGGVCFYLRFRRFTTEIWEDFMQKFNLHEEKQIAQISSLSEMLSNFSDTYKKETAQLKQLTGQIAQTSAAGFEKIDSQFVSVLEKQSLMAASIHEAIEAMRAEQNKLHAENAVVFAEKIKAISALIESASLKNKGAIEAFCSRFEEKTVQHEAAIAAVDERIKELRSEQNEQQVQNESLIAEKFAAVTTLVENASCKSDAEIANFCSKFEEKTAQHEAAISAVDERVKQILSEQSEKWSNWEQHVIAQTSDMSVLLSGISSNEKKVDAFAEQQQQNYNDIKKTGMEFDQKISDLLEKIPQLKNSTEAMEAVLLETFQQSADEFIKGSTQTNAEIATQSGKLDLLSDRCSELTEYLTTLKNESAENFKSLQTHADKEKVLLQEKLSAFEVAINSVLTESDVLRSDITSIAQVLARNEVRQSQQTKDLHDLVELRLAGLLSTLQLLESDINKGASHEAAKVEKVSKKEVKQESAKKKKTVIFSPNGDEIRYTPQPDGRTISKTYRKGKLCFEILHSQWGVPEKGTMYSETGEILRVFEYDSNGQVK